MFFNLFRELSADSKRSILNDEVFENSILNLIFD